MKTIKSISLENTDDGHYKEYRLSLEDLENGVFEVIALWGKIGSSLTRTVKFSGDQEKADKMFAKIVSGQRAKGYVQVGAKNDGQTAATVGNTLGKVREVIVRVQPMLCGALKTESEFLPYLTNDRYVAEIKYNGIRKMVMHPAPDAGDLTVSNKQGQESAKGMLPTTRAQFVQVKRSFCVDCEDEPVGGGCVLLDILALDGKPLDRLPEWDRRERLEAFYAEAGFDTKIVKLSRQVKGTAAKRAFLEELKATKAEGVIFKDTQAIYVGASREHQWKGKFRKSATFIVDAVRIGGKSNIGLALLDGKRRVLCGKVAVKANQDMPPVGACVEVSMLYVENGSNSLNQPELQTQGVGRNVVRDDVSPDECQISTQLAGCYKQTESEAQ